MCVCGRYVTEYPKYDYNYPEFSGDTGHFTQVSHQGLDALDLTRVLGYTKRNQGVRDDQGYGWLGTFPWC